MPNNNIKDPTLVSILGDFFLTDDYSKVNGTSFHRVYAHIDPQRLIEVLGEGLEGDEYKISREYIFGIETDDGKVYLSLYDWKETELYEYDLPTPEEVWNRSYLELHIGHTKENTEYALKLKDALELVAGAECPGGYISSERIGLLMDSGKDLSEVLGNREIGFKYKTFGA
tara:strand:- start:591 stop:1103 length:513 start_codon:yes stop_codon:yes gene_type:complete